MIRFLLRLTGYLLVGAGFVALVLDGARSIANQTVEPTLLGEIAYRLFSERYAQLQPMVERNLHPFLWDPLLIHLFLAPAFVVALVLGFVLLWLGRAPDPGIGYVTRA